MGAVNTTYTFTPTDTITSTKMNNIIDETVMTSDAVLGGSGGSGGLDISSGKLSISANAINSSRLAANSVTSTNIVDGTILNADISPTAAIAGTKIVAQFGLQDMSATGDLNLGGGSSDYTVLNLQNTSGVQVHLNANGSAEGSLRTVTNHPLSLATNNTERMRISADGNVGVGTSSPFAPLEVKGGSSIDANPDVRVSGSSGYIDIHNSLSAGGYNGITSSGDKAFIFTDGTVNTGNLVIAPWTNNTSGIRINSSGNVGICKSSPTTTLDVNGTVTATAFAGPLTGNVTGDVTGTATTVSNGAITAAKLNGAQSGSAPIFGVRAWANIDGTVGSVSVRQGGNVSGVVRNQLGRYTITFTTPMQDTNYAIVAWARDANATDNNYFVSAASNATKLAGSFQIEVNSPGGTVDSPEINIMVIR